MKSWFWAASVVVCCALLSHRPLGGGKSVANVERKLQAGALMPVYAARGMAISKEIVDNLNDRMDAGKGATEPDAK